MYARWVWRFNLPPVSKFPIRWLALLAMALMLAGCSVSVPKDIQVVSPFDVQRYLGQWYEVARLDHSFERNMNQVSATYSLNSDGSIKVLNRGYDTRRERWKEAVGRAEFVESPDVGALKVSFFGPFYGGYCITDLDQESYQWVMIVGNDLDYFWILSRDKTLDPTIKTRLLQRAKTLGVPTKDIIWVEQ